MIGHPFERAADPRKWNACLTCGRAEAVHGDPARDPVAEADFFHDVVATAQRLSGIYNVGYIPRVKARLQVGRERYGDADFMEKDVLRETLEETPDVAGYAVLELRKQKLLGLGEKRYEDLYQDLLAASAYACIADHYAQRAARRLTEARG